MNERIRQLALQAGVFAGDFAGAGLYSIHNKEEVEKFAELIVKECIWALWTEECRTSDLASEEYTRGSNKINDHFWS